MRLPFEFIDDLVDRGAFGPLEHLDQARLLRDGAGRTRAFRLLPLLGSAALLLLALGGSRLSRLRCARAVIDAERGICRRRRAQGQISEIGE
jgi:hypothetical protein